MEGVVRILRRFVRTTILISIFLIVINFILLGTYFFKGMNDSKSPQSVVQSVAEGLNKNDSTYSLDSRSEKLLKQLNCWAMLLDNTGHVSWSFNLPNQIPLSYSLIDIAQLSRSYLKNYPVLCGNIMTV